MIPGQKKGIDTSVLKLGTVLTQNRRLRIFKGMLNYMSDDKTLRSNKV